MVEILYAEEKYDVLVVKLFDRLHNMKTLLAKSPAKQRKSIIETMVYFIPIVAYFGKWKLEQELGRLCCQVEETTQLNYLQEQHDAY